MVYRLLLVTSFFFLINRATLAQTNSKQISIGVESSFLIGGETNASFDFLLGASGSYFFYPFGAFDLYSTVGLATDSFNPDSHLLLVDAQLGVYWQRRKRLSWFVSAGVNHLQESHRFLLNNGERNWQRSSFGLTAKGGVSLRLSESFSSTLFVKQINLNLTSIGLGLNYTF